MTTAIPADAFEHGDARRYRRGCRCRPCTSAVNTANRRRTYLRATGRGLLVDPDRAAHHSLLLRAAGVPDHDILASARINKNTLHRILRKAGQIHRDTERRVLAVPIPATPGPGNGADIDGTGTRRRLQALTAAGWPGASLGRRLGKDRKYIFHLLAQPDARVRGFVADRVRALYADLRDERPEDHGVPPRWAKHARERAARHKWVTAAYWDDDTIDNPDVRPAVQSTPRYVALAEDGMELERQGHTRQQAADRLGVTRDYLSICYRRWRKEQAADRDEAA